MSAEPNTGMTGGAARGCVAPDNFDLLYGGIGNDPTIPVRDDDRPVATLPEGLGAVPDFDEAYPEEQRTVSDRGHAVTNADFMSGIFGVLPERNQVAIASFADVAHPNWQAHLGQPEAVPDRPEKNSYFCPSSMLPGSKRDLEHFAALHVLVLDDITADVLAKLPPPTYALETSAGNFQVGYKLGEPLLEKPLARAIHQALQGAGYCDKSGNNPVRWVRLPVGTNTKPGKLFAHKLRVWEPDLTYSHEMLVLALGLNLDAEEAVVSNQDDPFTQMPEPKLRRPGVLAELLQKLNPDLERDDWRVTLSAIYTHLGDEGFAVARTWSMRGGKYFEDATSKHKLSQAAADKQFRKVWDEIASDIGFRRGGEAFFGLLKRLDAMTVTDIAQWHDENRVAGTTKHSAADVFDDLILDQNDVDEMAAAEFLVPGMIVRGHITLYPSPSGGGKTTLFIHFCEELCRNGHDILYINVDSPPDMIQSQFRHAHQHGYKLIAPDAKKERSVRDVIPRLQELTKLQPNSLTNTVIIIDTLKKFINVLDKGAASNFFKLLRAISARGATICLLGHTNKYLTPEGELIFEGVGDIQSDIDDMIYLYSTLDHETNIRDITTKPEKIRAAFYPRSFRIHIAENRRVEECTELLQIMTEDSRKVLKLVAEIVGTGAMNQKDLINALLESTPFGRDKLRAILHQLSEFDYSPMKATRNRENNALHFSLRKPVNQERGFAAF